jgi:HEPN domain-containing protein
MKRFEGAQFYVSKGYFKQAAFDLHQTTEFLYHSILLVLTSYTPHVHNLAFLRKQAEKLDRRLTGVWPTDKQRERAMFEKLKDAYVKARYSKHYRISEEELTWLSAQIEVLGRMVHDVCSAKIAELREAVEPS